MSIGMRKVAGSGIKRFRSTAGHDLAAGNDTLRIDRKFEYDTPLLFRASRRRWVGAHGKPRRRAVNRDGGRP